MITLIINSYGYNDLEVLKEHIKILEEYYFSVSYNKVEKGAKAYKESLKYKSDEIYWKYLLIINEDETRNKGYLETPNTHKWIFIFSILNKELGLEKFFNYEQLKTTNIMFNDNKTGKETMFPNDWTDLWIVIKNINLIREIIKELKELKK